MKSTIGKSLLIVFVLSLMVSSFSIACSIPEPIVPGDVAGKVRDNLGYALAPAWLPDGYEYSGPYLNVNISNEAFTGDQMLQTYNLATAGIESAIIMSYPQSEVFPPTHLAAMGLIPPNDAISTITVNKHEAFLYQGNWTKETIQNVDKLDGSFNTEWDYQGGYTIRFIVDIPDQQHVWVQITTLLQDDKITRQDLIRIAESVSVAE